jgi:hypothetical protein
LPVSPPIILVVIFVVVITVPALGMTQIVPNIDRRIPIENYGDGA